MLAGLDHAVVDARESRIDLKPLLAKRRYLERLGKGSWVVAMDRRTVLSGLVGALAVPSMAVAQTRQITLFRGGVDQRNVLDVLDKLASCIDQIVGIKFQIDLPMNGRFSAGIAEHDGRTSISAPEYALDLERGGSSVHGMVVVDGFFLLKSAGLYQGVFAFYGERVDEATIRLNPTLQIVVREV